MSKPSDDSLLVRTWHHSKFSDIGRLVDLKEKKGLTLSLAFPTLNEEATIGKEILVIRTELMDRYPLLDEIAVIDSSSKDRTRQVAERYGARVFESKDILPGRGTFRGKGENLWKSLYALQGDIIVWVDADIANIAPKFVYGLVGPLLEDDSIGYVKAFYERPIRSSSGIQSSGGGRVTEILVRPIFSLFYPELARLVQPLSGEYAGR
ncbi:MAG TPA: glucosyl-3-phosphoglycerate synthase, partial [Spirochaetia bacterium]|nr:glucosyl-3-phosphoglycerate synthase [Spirochaetia bacterium]